MICICRQASELIDTFELPIGYDIQATGMFETILCYHFLCQAVELYCHLVAIATVQYSVWVGGAKQC